MDGIARTYGHDLTTPEGRREFVAKASRWALQKPALRERVAYWLRNIASHVAIFRNIAPTQFLDAQMRGLARRAALRLRTQAKSGAGQPRVGVHEAQGESTPGTKFSQEPKGHPPNDARTLLGMASRNPKRHCHAALPALILRRQKNSMTKKHI